MKFFIAAQHGVNKVFLDVSTHVGFGKANQDEDTQLVQLGFYAMGLPTSKIPDPANRPIYAAVPLGAKCNGTNTDPLVMAIRALQLSRGGTQDGFVSPIGGTEGSYVTQSGQRATKLINVLVNNIFDATPAGMWPRLDKIGVCPPAVKSFVMQALTI